MSSRAGSPSPSTVTFLGLLVLAIAFVAGLRPAAQRSVSMSVELTNLWQRVIASNQTFTACAGINPDNYRDRLKALNQTQTEVGAARRLIDGRIALPGEVLDRSRAPFQLLDFQSERQILAEQLSRQARARGVAFQPGATNGLPQYTAELPNPALLWLRLFLSTQILETAIECQVGGVRLLQQLPAPSLRQARDAPTYLELPALIEVVGPLEGLLRFLSCLPLRGEEFHHVGLPVNLTNKPALFISNILVRKAAPDRPGEVQAELVVSGFVPPPPEPADPG